LEAVLNTDTVLSVTTIHETLIISIQISYFAVIGTHITLQKL